MNQDLRVLHQGRSGPMEAAIHLRMQNRTRVALVLHHRVRRHQQGGLRRDPSQNRTKGVTVCSMQAPRPEHLGCRGGTDWKHLLPFHRRLEELGALAVQAC